MSNPSRFIAALVFASVAASQSASAQSLSWTATYDGGLTWGNSEPVGADGIKIDAQGNTYVIGRRFTGAVPAVPGGLVDMLVKFGPSGQTLWQRDLRSPASTLLLDSQGRPTVSGHSATERYDASGTRLWTLSHYPLEGEVFEAAAAAAAPGDGIYLAGQMSGTSGSLDLALARVDDAGRLVWLRTWDGPQHRSDAADALGVDAAGLIYATGRSVAVENLAEVTHVATVCFGPDGALHWSHVLDAPTYSSRTALAVAAAGGAFLSVPFAEGPADWRALKYDAAGTVVWSRAFRDAFDSDQAIPEFAADGADGGVYVSARSTTGRPELVRYSAAGVEQWAIAGTDFVTGSPDAPESALRVDASGRANVVRTLAGGKLRASVYEATGTLAWSRDLDWVYYETPDPYLTPPSKATGLALSANGEMRIAAASSIPTARLLVLACDGTGAVIASSGPGRHSPDEGAVAARLDAAGNTIVLATGFSFSLSEFHTLKYDSAGELLWMRPTRPGLPRALALGPAGEAVVVGDLGSDPASQFGVVKNDADGNEVWTRTYTPPGFLAGRATSVVVDNTGSAYVVGNADGTGSRTFVLKYSADGSLLWVRQSPRPSSSQPFADTPHVALAPNGNVVVAGSAFEVGWPQYQVFVLDPAGNLVWSAVGTQPNGSLISALAVDLAGNVVLGDIQEGRLFKIDPTGSLSWSVGSPGGGRVVAVSVDAVGDVAAAYSYFGPCQTAKYSAAGALMWLQDVEGGPVANPRCGTIRSGDGGRVYVGGSYDDGSLGLTQAFVLAYEHSGQVAWARSFSGGGQGANGVTDLDLGPAGRVIAAGHAHSNATAYDVLTQSLLDEAPRTLLFHTVLPCRAFDSRDLALGGPEAVRANTLFEAQVAGRCGVPMTARSVALNVTVTGGTDGGHLTLFPAGRVPPPTSTINHPAFITRATQAVVSLGDGGRVVARAIQGSGSVHVILDVSGYFE